MSRFLQAFDEFEIVHRQFSQTRGSSFPPEWWDKLKAVCDAGFEDDPGIEFYVPLSHLVEGVIYYRHQVDLGQVMQNLDAEEAGEEEIKAYEESLGRIGRALNEIRAARANGPEQMPHAESLAEIRRLMDPSKNDATLHQDQAARMMGFGSNVRAFMEALDADVVPEGIVPPQIVKFEERQNGLRRSFRVAASHWESERRNETGGQYQLPQPEMATVAELFAKGRSIEEICRMKGLAREEVQAIVNTLGLDAPPPWDTKVTDDDIREMHKIEPTLTYADLANELTVSVSRITKVLGPEKKEAVKA